MKKTKHHALNLFTAICGAILLLFIGARYVEILKIRNSSNDFENFRSIITSEDNFFQQLSEVYIYNDSTAKKLTLLLLLTGLLLLIVILRKTDWSKLPEVYRSIQNGFRRFKEVIEWIFLFVSNLCRTARWGVLPDTRRRHPIIMQIQRKMDGRTDRFLFAVEASSKSAVLKCGPILVLNTDGIPFRLCLPNKLIWSRNGVSIVGDSFHVVGEDRTTACVTVHPRDQITISEDHFTVTLHVL